jgi:exopolysaccharide biosynthesis polyprenyl glycosylphosphotransferase
VPEERSGGRSVIGLRRFFPSPKRILDFTTSLALLVGLAPLLCLLALGVALDSRGPVFYRCRRVGRYGREFAMLKFRKMHDGASGPALTSAHDERFTRFGAFLARTKLDELPQLWNVLRGDMSLVGPRPERPVFVETFRHRIPGYMLRHKVKAGMTGWAQINGWRGNTSLEKRIEYDLYYIERWSLAFDLAILVKTLWHGFMHKNAY